MLCEMMIAQTVGPEVPKPMSQAQPAQAVYQQPVFVVPSEEDTQQASSSANPPEGVQRRVSA